MKPVHMTHCVFKVVCGSDVAYGKKIRGLRERSCQKGAEAATGTGVAKMGVHVTIGGARGAAWTVGTIAMATAQVEVGKIAGSVTHLDRLAPGWNGEATSSTSSSAW